MTRCKGQSHLEAELKRIEQKSGEGVMLRKPKSLYVAGRSTTLLKVKSFHDAEAVVLSYEPGKGKHKGRVGALNCKMANGTRFKVGTGYALHAKALDCLGHRLMVDVVDGARLSDAEREHPPAVGAIITYRFQELTPDGVPRFPSYIGTFCSPSNQVHISSTPL
jgi:DNA ligase-1